MSSPEKWDTNDHVLNIAYLYGLLTNNPRLMGKDMDGRLIRGQIWGREVKTMITSEVNPRKLLLGEGACAFQVTRSSLIGTPVDRNIKFDQYRFAASTDGTGPVVASRHGYGLPKREDSLAPMKIMQMVTHARQTLEGRESINSPDGVQLSPEELWVFTDETLDTVMPTLSGLAGRVTLRQYVDAALGGWN